MSGITTATIIAGLGAAANSLFAKGSKASAAAPDAQVNTSTAQASNARTALLSTAGGSAGSSLAPGEVGKNSNTIFGN